MVCLVPRCRWPSDTRWLDGLPWWVLPCHPNVLELAVYFVGSGWAARRPSLPQLASSQPPQLRHECMPGEFAQDCCVPLPRVACWVLLRSTPVPGGWPSPMGIVATMLARGRLPACLPARLPARLRQRMLKPQPKRAQQERALARHAQKAQPRPRPPTNNLKAASRQPQPAPAKSQGEPSAPLRARRPPRTSRAPQPVTQSGTRAATRPSGHDACHADQRAGAGACARGRAGGRAGGRVAERAASA